MSYVFEAKIKPNSPEFSIEVSDKAIISIKSSPENNKANIEIIKELSKLLNADVRIIKGLKSKNKTLWVSIESEDFKSKVLKQL